MVNIKKTEPQTSPAFVPAKRGSTVPKALQAISDKTQNAAEKALNLTGKTFEKRAEGLAKRHRVSFPPKTKS